MNLVPLTDTDRKVLKAAQEIIAKRFDSINFRHTVGVAGIHRSRTDTCCS